MDIRKGDNVKVMTGKDNGKTGKVLRVIPRDRTLLVENMNTVKKHVRARRQGETGQIVTVPRPLSVSKVLLVCKACGRATRISHGAGGKNRLRICKKCKSTF